MAQTEEGARLWNARRHGLSLAGYDLLRALGLKHCRSCQVWRLDSDFGVDRSRSDGRASRCQTCRSTPAPGPARAERRAKESEGLTWCRRCLDWVADGHAGLCRRHGNEAYRENYARNPDPIKARTRARKRRLDPIPGDWTVQCRADFQGACAYGCGRRAETDEHILPVVAGGASVAWNVVPACKSCNSSKRDRDPGPWIARGLASEHSTAWTDKVALAALDGIDLLDGIDALT